MYIELFFLQNTFLTASVRFVYVQIPVPLLGTAHLDPYDALKVHKSKVVIPCNQDISLDRQSGTVLRDLFKKLKQGMLDTGKVPDLLL